MGLRNRKKQKSINSVSFLLGSEFSSPILSLAKLHLYFWHRLMPITISTHCASLMKIFKSYLLLFFCILELVTKVELKLCSLLQKNDRFGKHKILHFVLNEQVVKTVLNLKNKSCKMGFK